MSDVQFHVDKAKNNEDFYISHSLETSKFNGWAITILFYVLLHYVDAVLKQDDSLHINYRDPNGHGTRSMAVAKCSKLDPIALFYKTMYERSIEARYYCINFPDHYFSNLVSRVYKPAQKYLIKCLKES